jgi:hypothetical protein
MPIADWLNGLGMGRYTAAFEQAGVGETSLPRLTAIDLLAMDVSLPDRLAMLDAIAALPKAEAKRRSEARQDFVRRFVAVAVSVGFASALVKNALADRRFVAKSRAVGAASSIIYSFCDYRIWLGMAPQGSGHAQGNQHISIRCRCGGNNCQPYISLFIEP